jgi:hypothetical protein
MLHNILKKLIFNITFFISILIIIYLSNNYLGKKIFITSQEINNLIIEKENREENRKIYNKINSKITQLERKYNFNFNDLKKELGNDNWQVNLEKIINFSSINKLKISTTADYFVRLNSWDDFFKLSQFLKNNKIEINSLNGFYDNNQFIIEIRLK